MGRSSATRVLCACEESQAVTERLRRMGIEAYSCDLLPTSGLHPEWHIQADALQVAKLACDAVLAFPPCTNLAVSGARWFDEKRRDVLKEGSSCGHTVIVDGELPPRYCDECGARLVR